MMPTATKKRQKISLWAYDDNEIKIAELSHDGDDKFHFLCIFHPDSWNLLIY